MQGTISFTLNAGGGEGPRQTLMQTMKVARKGDC
jgi:hypothetical protein